MSSTRERDSKVNEGIVAPKWVTSLSINGESVDDKELQEIFDEIDRVMGNINDDSLELVNKIATERPKSGFEQLKYDLSNVSDSDEDFIKKLHDAYEILVNNPEISSKIEDELEYLRNNVMITVTDSNGNDIEVSLMDYISQNQPDKLCANDVCNIGMGDWSPCEKLHISSSPIKYNTISVDDRLPDLYKWVTTIDEVGEHRVYRRTEYGWNMRDLDGINSPSNNRKIEYWLEEEPQCDFNNLISRELSDEEIVKFVDDTYDRCKSEDNLIYFSISVLNPILTTWRLNNPDNMVGILKRLLSYSQHMSVPNQEYVCNRIGYELGVEAFSLFSKPLVEAHDKFPNDIDISKHQESEENNEEYDIINKAKHYNSEVFPEVIEMMITLFGIEETKAFCKLNAFKYRLRCGNKDNNSIEQDINKAIWYENKFKELSKVAYGRLF